MGCTWRLHDTLFQSFEDIYPGGRPIQYRRVLEDMSGIESVEKMPAMVAMEIKDTIKYELGFTVNIGVSDNKILAKMASDFRKPDRVHTLFTNEIKLKLWPLPVRDLFFVPAYDD